MSPCPAWLDSSRPTSKPNDRSFATVLCRPPVNSPSGQWPELGMLDAVSDADDGLRVVLTTFVDEYPMFGAPKPYFARNCVPAEVVVLAYRGEDGLSVG